MQALVESEQFSQQSRAVTMRRDPALGMLLGDLLLRLLNASPPFYNRCPPLPVQFLLQERTRRVQY